MWWRDPTTGLFLAVCALLCVLSLWEDSSDAPLGGVPARIEQRGIERAQLRGDSSLPCWRLRAQESVLTVEDGMEERLHDVEALWHTPEGQGTVRARSALAHFGHHLELEQVDFVQSTGAVPR